MTMTNAIPAPSAQHATCAWCHRSFASIVELLDHVDADHLDASAPRPRHLTPTTGLAA